MNNNNRFLYTTLDINPQQQPILIKEILRLVFSLQCKIWTPNPHLPAPPQLAPPPPPWTRGIQWWQCGWKICFRVIRRATLAAAPRWLIKQKPHVTCSLISPPRRLTWPLRARARIFLRCLCHCVREKNLYRPERLVFIFPNNDRHAWVRLRGPRFKSRACSSSSWARSINVHLGEHGESELFQSRS